LPPQIIGNGNDYGAFVTKLNPAGSDVLLSVFLRQGQPALNGLVLDKTGSAYVAGASLREFVPTPGSYQVAPGSGFVAKITSPRSVVSVSAASYVGTTLASESIITAFGAGLATATQVATSTPLPTTLAGTTVKVRDSSGMERAAPLFFVSPTQINYLMPQGTASGAATVTITSANSETSLAGAQVASVAPGLFTANASGQGIAAAIALRVKADGTQIFEPISRFDPAQSQLVAVPIDLSRLR